MENIYWSYDAVLNADGNHVTVTAMDYSNAERYYEKKDANTNIIFYDPKRLNDLRTGNHEFIVDQGKETEHKDDLSGNSEDALVNNDTYFTPGTHKMVANTETDQATARSKNWVVLDSSRGAMVSKTTSGTIKKDSLIFTMDDVSVNINNQWAEGNGSSNFFNSVIDGMADMTNSGVIRSVESNVSEAMRTMGFDPNDARLIRWVRKINNQHYRTSTNFLKYYQGTNVSVPVALRRTFVTDEWNYDVGKDLQTICHWCCGMETTASNMLDGTVTQDDLMEHTQTGVQGAGSVGDKLAETINRNGGILQRAPLGYVYDPANWTRMFNTDQSAKTFEGTLTVRLPNNIVLGGMLVADCTIMMSQTQTLTKFGLRPTTVTVQLQLLPARLWGATDVQNILRFSSVN